MEQLAFGYGVRTAAVAAPRRTAPVEVTVPRFAQVDSLRVAYGALLLFTALLFFRPQDHFPALRPLHLAELTGIIGMAALVVGRARRGQAPSVLTPELLGVLVLGVVMLATVPFSIWPGGAFGVFTDMYLKVALIFALMVNTLTTPKRLERLIGVILVASAYIAARACLDYVTGSNLIEGGRVRGAVGGIFRNPNDLALNMVAFLPFPLMIVLSRASLLTRAVSAGAALLMIATVVFTKSRGGSLGLAVILIIFCVRAARLRPGILGVVALVSVLFLPAVPSSFWDRMSSIVVADRDDTGSRQARIDLLETAWVAFLDHPITGLGAGQFKNYNPPDRAEPWRVTHNSLLQVAAELGVFGLAVFMFLIIRAWTVARVNLPALARRRAVPRWLAAADGSNRGALRQRTPASIEADRLAAHAAAVRAGLVGWFVCAMFASVAFHWTFYYLLALAVAPVAIVRTASREAASPAPAVRPGHRRFR